MPVKKSMKKVPTADASAADALRGRITGMINWCNAQQTAKKATDETKAAAMQLLTEYRAFTGNEEARRNFVDMFEKTKSSKDFTWTKTFNVSDVSTRNETETCLGKYMTRMCAHHACMHALSHAFLRSQLLRPQCELLTHA